jgi:hypothetical protein
VSAWLASRQAVRGLPPETTQPVLRTRLQADRAYYTGPIRTSCRMRMGRSPPPIPSQPAWIMPPWDPSTLYLREIGLSTPTPRMKRPWKYSTCWHAQKASASRNQPPQ